MINSITVKTAQTPVVVSIILQGECFWLGLEKEAIDKPKTLSMGKYAIKRGLDRVLETLQKHGLKATFFVSGRIAELYPRSIMKIHSQGHEIACGGYCNENLADLTKDEQRKLIGTSKKILEDLISREVQGFKSLAGELTEETLELVSELGFSYSSNLLDQDLPYIRTTKSGSFVEIPFLWENYDLPYFAFNYRPAFPSGQGRVASYTQVFTNMRRQFDAANREHILFVPQFDPQTVGTPGRMLLLDSLLAYMKEKPDVWFAQGAQIADQLITQG